MINNPATSSTSANSGPTSYSGGMSNLRISGLASGIDVDSIVKKLMSAEAIPLDKMKQSQQQLEWQRDDYRSMNTSLLDLKNSAFDMKLQGTYLTKTTASSNDSVVTATAGTSAGNSTYTMSNVTMATAAYNSSATDIRKNGSIDSSESLATLQSQGVFKNGITFTANGTVDFDIITYDQNGKEMPGSHFSIDSSKSLDDVISTINSSGIGVNAFFDTQSGKLSITRTMTGNNNAVGEEMTFSGGFLTSTLALDSTKESGGADAAFTLNGLATTRHSNSFTINGTSFNIKGNTAANESVGITISNDVDTVFNKIKDFITKYNDTIKTINDKVSEKRNRDYPPLTDAQKANMKDTDIQLWTDKAKSGMLSNDTILSSALSEMRMDLYSPVSGVNDPTMNQLAQIGITTSSIYQDNGKLEIDETKLKQALSSNPDGVMELFTASGTTTGTQGLADRLYTSISSAIDKISQKAGSDSSVDTSYFLGNQISDMDTQISDFAKHLDEVQKRYYSQFTAMESAIQRANTQAGMIAGQFSGG